MEPYFSQLRQLLAERFDLSELQVLAFDLGVDYEELTGETKSAKAQALVAYVRRRDRLPELLDQVQLRRPTIAWPAPAPPNKPNPYLGLETFREEHASFYFGREADSQRLFSAVLQQPLVAVVGPSGSGKSSLAFAGLLPLLREARGWLIIDFRPGERPLHALAAALGVWLNPDLGDVNQLIESEALAKQLTSGTVFLDSVVDLILAKNPGASQLLLIADQFEELYTLCRDPETQKLFLDLLLNGLSQTVTLLLVLRADFLGQILKYRPLADGLRDRLVMSGPMSRQELEAAIVRPAEKLDVHFEAGLVDRILDDVGPEPGNLPLLEFALTQLWVWQRTDGILAHVAYETIGQVKGALARHAEAVYGGLTIEEQKLARRTLLQLVRPGLNTEDTRRRVTQEELDTDQWSLIQQLANSRLVVTGRDELGHETVEIIHETLIRHWDRLQRWLDDDRAFRLWQDRLRSAMVQWQANKQDVGALLHGAPLSEAEEWLRRRPADLGSSERAFIRDGIAQREREAAERAAQKKREQEKEEELYREQERRQRIFRFSLVGLVVLIVVTGLAIFSLVQRNMAQEAAQEADQARNEAEARSTEAIVAQTTAEMAAKALATSESNALAQATEADVLRQRAVNAEATAIVDRDEADRLRQIARVQSLAAQAARLPDLTDYDTELAALVALEASHMNHTIDAGAQGLVDNSLRTILTLPYFNTRHRFTPASYLPSDFILHDQVAIASTSDGGWSMDLANPATGPRPIAAGGGIIHPEGLAIIYEGTDGSSLWWQALDDPSSDPLLLGVFEDPFTTLTMAPDGQQVASGHLSGTALVWDVSNPQSVPNPQFLPGATGYITEMNWSGDGRWLAASVTPDIYLWDMTNPASNPRTFTTPGRGVDTIRLSPDGRWLAAADFDGRLHLWDLKEVEAEPISLDGHVDGVTAMAFTPDSQSLASAGRDQEIHLWDLNDRARPLVVLPDRSNVLSIAFTADGQTMVSATMDGYLRQWHLGTPAGETTIQSFARASGNRPATAFDPTWRYWSYSQGANIHLRRLDDPNFDQIINTDHLGGIAVLAFSPNGKLLASAGGTSNDTTIQVWQMANPVTSLHTFTETFFFNQVFYYLAFSPDSQTLAATTGNSDLAGRISLRNLATPSSSALYLSDGLGTPGSFFFTPNGQSLVTLENNIDGSFKRWDLAAPDEEPQIIPTAQASIFRPSNILVLSPDGTMVAAGGPGVTLWPDGRLDKAPVVLVDDPEGSWGPLAFSPDGRILAVALDSSIYLWETASPADEPIVLTGHTGTIYTLAFSPNGKTLGTIASDGSMRLWPTPTRLAELACQLTYRDLSLEEWHQHIGDDPYHPTCQR